jgi:hypothetical protein
MKLEVSKRLAALAIALSLVVGIGTSQLYVNYWLNYPVPQATWAELVTSDISSVQVDMSDLQMKDGKLDTWIREDSPKPFHGSTGVVGTTILSHVQMDCTDMKLDVLEQRGFTPLMDLLGDRKGTGPAEHITDLGPGIALLAMCAGTSGKSFEEEEIPAPRPDAKKWKSGKTVDPSAIEAKFQ